MKVSTETVATREVVVTLEPEPDLVAAAKRRAAQKLTRARPLPGYRPGKAPYAMAERAFGKDLIEQQALEDNVEDWFRAAMQEAKLEPFDPGKLDVASHDPLVLKVRVPLVPTVELGEYGSLRIEPEPAVVVTEAQIEEELARVRQCYAQYETIETLLVLGNQIVVTIEGLLDGAKVVDQTDATVTVDDALNPPGFAEALVGMKAGDKREFSLAYPQDYADSKLAGKDVAFTVSIKTVRKVTLPAVDDDLAKQAGDWANVTELREGLALRVKDRLEFDRARKEEERALDALVGAATVEYPTLAVDRELESAVSQQKHNLERVGFQYDKYLQMIGKSEQQLRDEERPKAEQRLVRGLVLREYGRNEKIEVSPEELAKELQSVAQGYGDRANDAMQQLMGSGAYLQVRDDMFTRRAVEKLAARLTGRETLSAEIAPAAVAPTDSVPAALT